jgi:hypothetical protein
MKAESLYKKIYTNGTMKLKRSLETIKRVCDDFEERQLKIFVASIGHECDRRYPSPKLQSIRNNKSLISYIELREKEQVIKPKNFDSFNNEDLVALLQAYKKENICLRGLLMKKIVI